MILKGDITLVDFLFPAWEKACKEYRENPKIREPYFRSDIVIQKTEIGHILLSRDPHRMVWTTAINSGTNRILGNQLFAEKQYVIELSEEQLYKFWKEL